MDRHKSYIDELMDTLSKNEYSDDRYDVSVKDQEKYEAWEAADQSE